MSQNIDCRLVSYFKKGIKGIQRYIGLQILYISVCMHVISALLGLIIMKECYKRVLEAAGWLLCHQQPAQAAATHVHTYTGSGARGALQGIWANLSHKTNQISSVSLHRSRASPFLTRGWITNATDLVLCDGTQQKWIAVTIQYPSSEHYTRPGHIIIP